MNETLERNDNIDWNNSTLAVLTRTKERESTANTTVAALTKTENYNIISN